jgi:hypothetical protein
VSPREVVILVLHVGFTCNGAEDIKQLCCFCSGQVLQHVNLGEFVGRNVPSLKEFEKAISNGSSMGALPLLRTAMQLLQRCVRLVLLDLKLFDRNA